MISRRVLVVSLLVPLSGGMERGRSWAAEPTGDPTAAAVDALFAAWAKPDSPGCALAVVRGGKVVYAKGFGMAGPSRSGT